jgi:hypothetical protein
MKMSQRPLPQLDHGTSPGVKNGYWVNLPVNAEVSNDRIITLIAIVHLSAMALEFYWTPEYM